MSEALSVLIIEDSEDDALLLLRELRRGDFKLTWERVQTAEALCTLLAARNWDVIVSDYSLPGFNAPAALKIVQQNHLDIPFIVVSGTIGETTAVEMMKAGANDYLIKGNLTRLPEAIRREVRDARVRAKRKQAEIALIQSEARSRAILAAMPDLMFRVGADGVYREMVTNKPELEMFLANRDPVGLFMEEILPAPIANRKRYYLERALLTGELQVYEQRMLVGDRWRDEEIRVVKSGDDEVLVMVRDITDRKEAELALERLNAELEERVMRRTTELQEREARYRALMEGASDAILVMDFQGNLLEVNRKTETLFGYSRDQLTQMHSSQLHPLDDRELMVAALQDVIQGQRTELLDMRILRQDGQLVAVDISATIVNLGDTQIIQSIFRDISERKRSEAELQTLSKRLTVALKSGAIGCWDWDIQNNTVFWDERMYELYGLSPSAQSEVAYETWANSVHPEDRQPAETLLLQTALGLAEYEAEFRVMHPDGSLHYIKAYGMLVRNAQGQPQSVIGVNFDISDRKQAEQTIQITNEELLRATRLKDEFLANMSHELRTPLNAILGLTEVLQDRMLGPLTDRQLNALQTVERSGTHLLELINDILDVAKIESGQFDLDCTRTEIQPLCLASLAFVKQQALKKRIQLETKIPASLPDLQLDQRRMRQVLINLLNNAVKFTPDGGRVTLEVSLCSQAEFDSPSPYLRFAVSDTGIGIAPENLQKLFQPFIQIDTALNRQYQGTGLGLMLVKRIVELHGGQVGLTSQVGVGSCFTIDLPYTAGNSLVPLPPCEIQPTTVVEEPISQACPLILLAEDNEANIMMISTYLRARGYQILVAQNGAEAIAQAQAQRPDLILMDIQMPGMDGIEAMQQLRSDPDLTHIPIIALTAFAMEGDRDRCLAAGANEYISKPVRLKQLFITIQQLLATQMP